MLVQYFQWVYKFLSTILGQFSEIIIAFLFFLGILIGIQIFKKVILQRIKKWTKSTSTDLDDLLVKIISGFKFPYDIFLSLLISSKLFNVPDFLDKGILIISIIVLNNYVVQSLNKIAHYGINKLFKLTEKQGQPIQVDPMLVYIADITIFFIMWGIVAITVLQNLGYNVTALIGGLGVVGIGLGMKLQSMFSEISAFLTLYLDEPFKIGDYITISGTDKNGTVNRIGLRTTRIKTLTGNELIIPNKELIETAIDNYGKMDDRKVFLKFGVTYETPLEKVKLINKFINDIFAEQKDIELLRTHFKELADSSLNFEVLYKLNTSDYRKYLDTKEELNLKLMEKFEKEGIEFAYPTQQIYVTKKEKENFVEKISKSISNKTKKK